MPFLIIKILIQKFHVSVSPHRNWTPTYTQVEQHNNTAILTKKAMKKKNLHLKLKKYKNMVEGQYMQVLYLNFKKLKNKKQSITEV